MPPATDLSQYMNQNQKKASGPAPAPDQPGSGRGLGSGRGQKAVSLGPVSLGQPIGNRKQSATSLGSPRRGANQAEAFRTMAKSSVLMRKHPPEAQAYIQRSCKMQKVAAGEVVYQQGAASDSFYMIETGRFHATQTASDGTSSQLVREFGPGDTFGSHELLSTGGPRLESVACAAEAGSLWVLPRKVFDAKLKAAPAPGPKLLERMRQIPLFSSVSNEQLTLICRAAVDLKLEKHELLCTQGDRATHVYGLIDGQLKRVVDDEDDAKTIVKAPRAFGDEGMYPDEEQRQLVATYSAWGGVASVVKFAVADLEALLGFELQARAMRQFNKDMLGQVNLHGAPILDGCDEAQLEWLSGALVHEGERDRRGGGERRREALHYPPRLRGHLNRRSR